MHAKHFEIWKNILWNWRVDCSMARSIKCCGFSWRSQRIHFPFYAVFFSQKNCVLWSFCLLLGTELITLDTSGKPIVGFFLKITSLSWKVLSISLDVLNSIDWLLKSWWWIFLKWLLFYFCKKSLIWQKILQIFGEFILILSFEYYREC